MHKNYPEVLALFQHNLQWPFEIIEESISFFTNCFSHPIFFENVWQLNAQCMILRHQLYLGMSLQLTDEAVGGEAQFGNARVPDVFD